MLTQDEINDGIIGLTALIMPMIEAGMCRFEDTDEDGCTYALADAWDTLNDFAGMDDEISNERMINAALTFCELLQHVDMSTKKRAELDKFQHFVTLFKNEYARILRGSE